MAWFKVDDALPTHRKVLSIPRGARRLAALGAWTMGGAWSSSNLTEGKIPKPVLDDLGISPKVAADLCASGLWLDESTHYQMHDFLHYNPTSEQVRNDRAAAAERQRRAREKAAAKRAAEQAAERETEDSHAPSHGVTNAVTHASRHSEVTRVTSDTVTVPPTRPDPTRPALVLELAPTKTKSKTSAQYDPDFLAWYSIFPRHIGKDDAAKAYAKAREKASQDELIAGAQQYRDDPTRKPDFTKYPAAWLRAGRWQDEAPAPSRHGRPDIQTFTEQEYVSGW